MANIQILLVEDEPIIAADLENQLSKLGYEIIGTMESGEEAIEIVKKQVPDIIIMDINLEGDLDGIETAHEISKFADPAVIFLTSNTDQKTFARAKFTKPHAFLSKPFRTTDIIHSIDLAILGDVYDPVTTKTEVVEAILADRLFLRDKSYLHKVMLKDILVVEADGAYCKISTQDKVYVLSQSLKKIQEGIDFPPLIRVHRSFIANVDRIDRLSEGYVFIDNHKVPIGRAYKDELQKLFRSL